MLTEKTLIRPVMIKTQQINRGVERMFNVSTSLFPIFLYSDSSIENLKIMG